MASIAEEVAKKVNRPIAAIARGELYFAALPIDGIGHFLNQNTGTTTGTAHRIRTTSGINLWASDHDGTDHDVIVTRMGLAIGAPVAVTVRLNGPVILTGECPHGDVIPLTGNQVEHLINLATVFRSGIVIVTNEPNE